MKQSLEKRIILFFFVILSLTFLANTAMDIAVFRKEYVREILLRSQTLGTSLKAAIEKVLALGIEISDLNGLEERCREIITTSPEISYCVITDSSGNAIFSSDPAFAKFDLSGAHRRSPYSGSNLANVALVSEANTTFFDVRVPVNSFDSKEIASIHIGFPRQIVDRKVYFIIERAIVIFLVFFSMSFAIVILFVKRSIIAPIGRLLEGMTRISQGEFKTTIESLPVQELDQLGIKINAMSAALDTRDRELRKNYDELAKTHEQLHNSFLKLETLSRDLEKSEELYKKLQEEAGDSIIVLDGSEKIIIANKMAETFFGYPASQIIGQHISSLLIRLNAQNIPHHLKMLNSAYQGPPVDDEIVFTNGRLEQLIGRLHASCVVMEETSLLQVIIRDITKEREFLQNLENSAAGLARLNRMKDSFLGLASHELKTPLTVIMGYSELLLTDMRDQLTETSGEMVQNISAAAARLDNIVRDMIDISMIDQKQLELKLGQVNINGLIETVLKELHFFLTVRKQHVITRLDASLPMMIGDQFRLAQMLSNIIGNAIKFTPDGGSITITTSLKQPEQKGAPPDRGDNLTERAGTQQPCIEIVISDTGIGIDRDDQQRIFDKFYEAGKIEEHSSGKVAFKSRGAGLGLSIAKGVVDRHGGQVWVESAGYDPQVCPGSSFFILLPLEQE